VLYNNLDMADEPQRPSMDGIRTNRGTAVVPTPAQPKPQPQPAPESHKSMGKQAASLAKAPITNTKQAPAPAVEANPITQPQRPRRRLRGFLKWLLILIIIGAILGGLYYGYLAYYAV